MSLDIVQQDVYHSLPLLQTISFRSKDEKGLGAVQDVQGITGFPGLLQTEPFLMQFEFSFANQRIKCWFRDSTSDPV